MGTESEQKFRSLWDEAVDTGRAEGSLLGRQPAELHVIEPLESPLGVEAQKEYLPMQAVDVPATFADADDLVRDVGLKPSTPLETGIRRSWTGTA